MNNTCVWLVYKCVFIARKWREQCGLSVSELWDFTVRASHIVFLFVNNENNFIKEIKHVVRASIARWKLRQSLFSLICAQILPNVRIGFHRGLWRHGKYVLFLNLNIATAILEYDLGINLDVTKPRAVENSFSDQVNFFFVGIPSPRWRITITNFVEPGNSI